MNKRTMSLPQEFTVQIDSRLLRKPETINGRRAKQLNRWKEDCRVIHADSKSLAEFIRRAQITEGAAIKLDREFCLLIGRKPWTKRS